MPASKTLSDIFGLYIPSLDSTDEQKANAVDLAHRLSIGVLAESVESQEEKVALEKLAIDGCQGFYIGKPLPL